MAKLKVMIVDDHPAVRKVLKSVVETADDMELLATASSGPEAIELCSIARPDVILMDFYMPGMNGLVASGIIHDQWTSTKIIIITNEMFPLVDAYVGYVPPHWLNKGSTTPDEILDAIRTSMLPENPVL